MVFNDTCQIMPFSDQDPLRASHALGLNFHLNREGSTSHALEISGISACTTYPHTHWAPTSLVFSSFLEHTKVISTSDFTLCPLYPGALPVQPTHLYYFRVQLKYQGASLVVQWKRLHLPMQETWVWSLGWEDPLEKKMATHSSILAWKIPWTEEPGRL